MSRGGESGTAASRGSRLRLRLPQVPDVARAQCRRDERELDRLVVDRPRDGLAARARRGRVVVERQQGDGELLDAVRSDQRRHLGVREAQIEPPRQAGRPRCGTQLREHRAGVPEDVPEAALGITPPGAPRHPGDHDGRSAVRGGRAHPPQRVLHRVVPVDAVRKARHRAGGDVHLEGEPRARRARGPQEHGRPRRMLHDADDSGGEVEDPPEHGEVEHGGGDHRRSGEHARRRLEHGGQIPRQRRRRQPAGVALDPRGPPVRVVRGEILQDARVVHRPVPPPGRRHRGELVIEPRRVPWPRHHASLASRGSGPRAVSTWSTTAVGMSAGIGRWATNRR